MDLLAPASAEKRSLAMAGWTKGLCLSQAVLGVAFAYSATMHFYSYTQTTGQLIGLLMVATAVAGALGAAKKSRPLLAGYLVGVLLAMLLTFAFVGQVSREVEVDCALAQLEIRVEALERSEQGAGHHALFGSLFTRLDEMEGLLDMVQHGTAHVVHHRSEQKNLAVTDRAYVQAKIDMLKALARELIDDPGAQARLQADPNDANAQAAMEERRQLENRLDAAGEVLRRIAEHENAQSEQHELTPDEYAAILEALATAHVNDDILKAHRDATSADIARLHSEGKLGDKEALLLSSMHEVPNMGAAMKRQKDNEYHKLEVGGAGARVEELRMQRADRREKWSAEFESALEEAKKQHVDVEGHLQDMPEMCLENLAGRESATSVGYFLCVVQAAAAYLALNVLFDLPTKHE